MSESHCASRDTDVVCYVGEFVSTLLDDDPVRKQRSRVNEDTVRSAHRDVGSGLYLPFVIGNFYSLYVKPWLWIEARVLTHLLFFIYLLLLS